MQFLKKSFWAAVRGAGEPRLGPEMLDATLRSPQLIELYKIWRTKCGERLMPARGDMDPGEMVPLLPEVFMIDVSSTPRRFRVRLVGTGIVSRVGRESTGKFFDESNYGSAAAGLHRLFSLVCDTRSPVAKKGYVSCSASKGWIAAETLLLPLSSDGSTVDILFGGMARPPAAARYTTPPRAVEGRIKVSSKPTMYAFLDPIIDGVPHSRCVRAG